MQVETISNDSGVTLLMVPENEMEEQVLKQFIKQENVIVEIRNPVNLLTKTVKSGIMLAKKSTSPVDNTSDAT